MNEEVAAIAARRAALEREGAAAFTAVTQALIELRADVRIVDLSARAIAEELRHSEIYFEIARAYGAKPDVVRAEPIAIPSYPGLSPREERMIRVVGMCSINETMACSFLELCLAQTTEKDIRAGLREVLEDEIRHARIGWAYLGCSDVTAKDKRLVGEWLAPLLDAQWKKWKEQIRSLPDFELPSHGCPSGRAIAAASLASMRDLVLPGFEAAGVDVSAAKRWLEGETQA